MIACESGIVLQELPVHRLPLEILRFLQKECLHQEYALANVPFDTISLGQDDVLVPWLYAHQQSITGGDVCLWLFLSCNSP